MNIFLEATRRKYRFVGINGQYLTVEDLWDLPLTSAKQSNLDHIAVTLDDLLSSSRKSFVEDVSFRDVETQNMFEIVKEIIAVKKKESTDRLLAEARRAEKQKLLEILSRKKDGELENMSIEDIESRIAAL